MRSILTIFLLYLLSSFTVSSENKFVGWKTYLSHYNTNKVEESADKVFVVAEGTLYTYGKEDNYKYENIINKTIETKITIPSIDDIIFNDNINNYFTSTGKTENQEAIYIKELDGTASTKLTRTTWNIVPCISINKEKLISGTGEYNTPYRTES